MVALAVLATLCDAVVVRAQQVPCEAVDEWGMPRNCTLSERLGMCGYEAWQSWKACVDEDGDGDKDVPFWMEQYCSAWAAFDLLACGLMVPWDYFMDL
jgi:hypothetical protein